MTKEQIKENLKSMSLGDHLEELRARLILMLLGVVVGLFVALIFGSRLVSSLEAPYFHAVQKQNQSDEEKSQSEDILFSTENLVNIKISEQNIN